MGFPSNAAPAGRAKAASDPFRGEVGRWFSLSPFKGFARKHSHRAKARAGPLPTRAAMTVADPLWLRSTAVTYPAAQTAACPFHCNLQLVTRFAPV